MFGHRTHTADYMKGFRNASFEYHHHHQVGGLLFCLFKSSIRNFSAEILSLLRNCYLFKNNLSPPNLLFLLLVILFFSFFGRVILLRLALTVWIGLARYSGPVYMANNNNSRLHTLFFQRRPECVLRPVANSTAC